VALAQLAVDPVHGGVDGVGLQEFHDAVAVLEGPCQGLAILSMIIIIIIIIKSQ
jgi:hypothetical protein